jgi:hypothetical protein
LFFNGVVFDDVADKFLDALIFLRGEFLRAWGAFSKSSTSGRNTGPFLHPPYSAEALYSLSFSRETRRLSYTPFAGDRKTIRIRKLASAVILKSPNEYSYRDGMMIHRFHNQIGKACALAVATLILPVPCTDCTNNVNRSPYDKQQTTQ